MKDIKSLFLLTGILAILLSCQQNQPQEMDIIATKDTILVTTIPIKEEVIQKQIHASGQFSTDETAILAFKTGGIAEELPFEEGDYVRKDEVLGRLNMTEINALVNKAEIGFEKAQRDFLRTQNLFKDSVATREQRQNAKTAMDLATEELETARFNQSHSTIKAPYNGYIAQKLITSGQIVSGGTPVYAINGLNTQSWRLKVHVSDRDWAAISPGDSAHISAGSFPDKTFFSKVSKKAKLSDPMTGTFWIELSIPSSLQKNLASGMFGTATLFPDGNSSSWEVPHESVLDANGNTGYIFITNGNNIAQQLKIQITGIGENGILIQGNPDILGNAQLIVDGSAYLKQGSLVRVAVDNQSNIY